VPLQITRGGSIIMVQVENKYGSFGNDHDYTNAIRSAILDAGFEVTLYTAPLPGRSCAGWAGLDVVSRHFGQSLHDLRRYNMGFHEWREL